MTSLSDITERFRFVDESLVYVDAPLEGFVLHVANGVRYAFRTREIIANTVWHWGLLPAGDGPTTVRDVFTSARVRQPAHWLSVIEDRRQAVPRLEFVEMRSAEVRPPIEAE